MSVLPWVVFLPLIAGAVAFLLPPTADKLRQGFSAVVASATFVLSIICLLYTSPSPRDGLLSRMPSSA